MNLFPILRQFAFRSILKKDATWNWSDEHEEAFKRVNQEVGKKHFKNRTAENCDASKQGLDAVLQQWEENKWKPIAYAFRFLTELESEYSNTE